jgi:hypothetical protein
LYNYQIQFGVRMVRINVYPTPDFGKSTNLLGWLNVNNFRRRSNNPLWSRLL